MHKRVSNLNLITYQNAITYGFISLLFNLYAALDAERTVKSQLHTVEQILRFILNVRRQRALECEVHTL